jgi:hypothetical protein
MMIGSRKTTPPRMLRIVPHLLQPELRHPGLVRGDRGALHADTVPLDGVRRVDGHLVVGLIAVLDRQVVVLELHLEVRQDQLLPDLLPDDPGHLVAVELHDRVVDLNFRHRRRSSLAETSAILELWLARIGP